DQAKSNGQYVDLGAISSAVLKCAVARDCFTMIIKEENSEIQRLVSFWVPAEMPLEMRSLDYLRKTVTSLFDEIHSHLPDYMIPSYLLPMQSIPIRPSGKLDKEGLVENFR